MLPPLSRSFLCTCHGPMLSSRSSKPTPLQGNSGTPPLTPRDNGGCGTHWPPGGIMYLSLGLRVTVSLIRLLAPWGHELWLTFFCQAPTFPTNAAGLPCSFLSKHLRNVLPFGYKCLHVTNYTCLKKVLWQTTVSVRNYSVPLKLYLYVVSYLSYLKLSH